MEHQDHEVASQITLVFSVLVTFFVAIFLVTFFAAIFLR